MLQRYGVIIVQRTLTAYLKTAGAGIIKSADIPDVFARKITMLLLSKNAYQVRQHLEVINVAIATVVVFFVVTKPITK